MTAKQYRPAHGGHPTPWPWPPYVVIHSMVLDLWHHEYRAGELYLLETPYMGWRAIADDGLPRLPHIQYKTSQDPRPRHR